MVPPQARDHRRNFAIAFTSVEMLAEPGTGAPERSVRADVTRSAPAGDHAARLIDEQRAAGVRVVECTAELLARLSGPRRATGLAAIARRSEATLDDLTVSPDSVFVVLHMLRNPGNVGGIIRTAVSAGAHGVLVIGSSADPYAPESVRASMGAIFGIPVVEPAEVEGFFDWAVAHDVQTVGTSPTRRSRRRSFSMRCAGRGLTLARTSDRRPRRVAATATRC